MGKNWNIQGLKVKRLKVKSKRIVTASGEGPVKARSEMLKFAIEREQSQACLSYAEREQIERS